MYNQCHLISYDHSFSMLAHHQIGHQTTCKMGRRALLIFLRGLCGHISVNTLTLPYKYRTCRSTHTHAKTCIIFIHLPIRAQSTAVKMLICTACWRDNFACLIHSLKCCNICSLCLCAIRTKAYRWTELSVNHCYTKRQRTWHHLSLWGEQHIMKHATI